MKNKHIPQRTCAACRQIMEKRNLTRLVRTSDGTVAIDISAKKEGRGTYLCPNKGCWALALKKNRLEHALRTKLRNNDLQVLIEYSNNLPEES